MAEFDTTSATATADDILNGKTAYVKGEKIKGTIQSKLGGAFTPTIEPQVICPAGMYTSSAFSVKGDANLKPSNIRKGVEIFGVEGNAAVNDTPSGTLPDDVKTISLRPNVPNIGTVQGGGAVSKGMTVTVGATPYKNAYFYGWKDGDAIVSNDESYSLKVDSSKDLTAVFSMEANTPPPNNFEDIPHYRIATSASPQDAGVIFGNDGVVEGGTQISITATAADGYEFTAWKEKGQTVSETADYSFTAGGNRNLIANFKLLPVYKISASVSPDGSGSVTGAGEYFKGKQVSLIAVPEFWYKFKQWREGNEIVSDVATYNFIAEKNRELTAEFVDKVPSGYTILEYIESSGKSFIDTGTAATASTKVSMDVETLQKNSTAYPQMFFNSMNVPSNCRFTMQWASTEMIALVGTNASSTRISANMTPRRMNISLDANTLQATLDGTTVNVSGNKTFNASMTNIFLLGYNATNTLYALPARIYSCQIYNGGTLIRDFVPVLDQSGIAGLYDAVYDTFYASTSSTPFTAGPSIE